MALDPTAPATEAAGILTAAMDVPAAPSPLNVTLTDAAMQQQPVTQSGDSGVLDVEGNPEILDPQQPIQVAGLLDVFSRRVLKAERKVLPPLPDKPVNEIAGHLVIRGLDPEEIASVARVVGDDAAKGINFPKIAAELGVPDAGDYLARLKAANATLFEEARRGTMNIDALVAEANKRGADEVVQQFAREGSTFGAKAEDVVAGVLATIALQRETQAAWVAAFAIADPVQRQAAMVRATQLMALERTVVANVSGAGSEAGRTLYGLSAIGKATGVDLAGRASELTRLFGADAAKDIEFVGEAYLSLPTQRARAEFARQGLASKSMDVMAEVYINSLLSAPTTHLVNVFGNASFMAMRNVETLVAGGIGGVRSSITGNADRVYMREALAQLQGMRDGFLDAMLVAGKSFVREEGSDIVTKVETRNRRAIGKHGDPRDVTEQFRNGNYLAGAVDVLGISVRTPGRFLLAEDEMFRAIGYRMHLHQEAELRAARLYEQAVESGKPAADALALANAERTRVLTDPPQAVIQSARDAAKEMTFQKDLDGVLGNIGEALSHPIAKLFVPFYKTPTNIAKAVLERSPVQFVNPGFYRKLAAGGREADMAMAKVAVGSSIMGAFAGLAMGLDNDGAVIISGSGPNDPQAKDAFARKGMQPYSIGIRQDDGSYRTVTYSRFDPLSGLLAMSADFAYYAAHEPNGHVLEDLAAAATIGLASYMLDQPLLQGVNQIADAVMMGRTDREGATQRILQIMGERAGTAATAFIPGSSALGGAVSRTIEPTRSNTMLPDQGPFGEDPLMMPEFMRGFYIALQKAKANNPYFNRDLPPALNAWGEVMTAGDGTVFDFLSPVKIRNSKYSPVDDEVMRLGGGVAPFPKRISGIELSAIEYNRWIELTNTLDMFGKRPGEVGYRADKTLLPILNEVINDPGYRALPSKEAQRDQLSGYVSQFRAAGKQHLMLEQPFLKARIDAKE